MYFPLKLYVGRERAVCGWIAEGAVCGLCLSFPLWFFLASPPTVWICLWVPFWTFACPVPLFPAAPSISAFPFPTCFTCSSSRICYT